jgi:hypothetical protein
MSYYFQFLLKWGNILFNFTINYKIFIFFVISFEILRMNWKSMLSFNIHSYSFFSYLLFFKNLLIWEKTTSHLLFSQFKKTFQNHLFKLFHNFLCQFDLISFSYLNLIKFFMKPHLFDIIDKKHYEFSKY